MKFEALDGTKLIIMMIAGAAFAGVGLYLLLRPKPQNAAKLEIFGLKFESSSAGLLVFLIGAAFLAIPLFVPERSPSRAPTAPRAGTGQVIGAVQLPAQPQVEESEPNESPQTANVVGFGQTVSGDVRKGEADWFAIELPDPSPRDVRLMIRHVSGGYVRSELFNAAEERIGTSHHDAGAQYVLAETGQNTQFFVRISASYGNADYEFALQAVEN